MERKGLITKWKKNFFSSGKLEDLVQQIAGRCNRIVNESVPIADARLEGVPGVSIVLSPVALNGPVITIRRFPNQPVTMQQLVNWGR